MREFQQSSLFYGANAPYVEELYEQYLVDPASVPETWRKQFDSLPNVAGNVAPDVAHTPVIEAFAERAKQGSTRIAYVNVGGGNAHDDKRSLKVLQFIRAHRVLGSRHSSLDPLKRSERMPVPELELSFYGLTDADLEAEFSFGSWQGRINGQTERARLKDIVSAVKKTYCGYIGLEYIYISSTEQKRWIQNQFESIQSQPSLQTEEKQFLLERLTAAETLEKYLHTRYVGQKRFSLEGGESLIPLLDDIIQVAGGKGVKEVVLGMAHRGRLNVLAHTVGRPYETIFAEFEGGRHVEAGQLTPEGGTGDVKYHHGAEGAYVTGKGKAITVTLCPNPSHLEFVAPVVDGRARARQTQRRGRDAHHDPSAALPVTIHGDAAFAGQGVIAETLNLGALKGYRTGGTLHIITNNQVI